MQRVCPVVLDNCKYLSIALGIDGHQCEKYNFKSYNTQMQVLKVIFHGMDKGKLP